MPVTIRQAIKISLSGLTFLISCGMCFDVFSLCTCFQVPQFFLLLKWFMFLFVLFVQHDLLFTLVMLPKFL